MIDDLSRCFAALADPTRRDLVARLAIGDATVGELAAPYDMSLQAVSKHLGVLEAAGLVTRRREAQRRRVHLEAGALAGLTDWIDLHRARAESRLSRLESVLARAAADTPGRQGPADPPAPDGASAPPPGADDARPPRRSSP